jgi:hypothetical protein
MPQALSKATIGTFDPLIYSLPLSVAFPKSLEGNKSNNFAEAM